MIVAGLMSGTSVDGVDVALVDISGEAFHQSVQPLAAHSVPYADDLREAILGISNASTHTSRISQMNFLLGTLFGDAVVEACERANVPLEKLELVGSHGQTIYHQGNPSELLGRDVASTLQIGEPALIAARTGAPVVADFRTADMAAGGQGAPLAPYADYVLYRDRVLGRVALNIGGIANISAIPAAAESGQVMAFDTGPGNMLVDALMQAVSRGEKKFDEDGKLAASGTVNSLLLEELMALPYLREKPPKSTGREQFGTDFVADLLKKGLDPRDLMATLTAFTASSIADAVRRFVAPVMKVDQLIASGGGVRNPRIMSELRDRLPGTKIRTSNEFGIDSDAKEAIAFAVLAYETYHRRPANLPAATGAKRSCVLGKLVWA